MKDILINFIYLLLGLLIAFFVGTGMNNDSQAEESESFVIIKNIGSNYRIVQYKENNKMYWQSRSANHYWIIGTEYIEN